MKEVSSSFTCCPCSWPYFLTLSYISGTSRKSRNMEETLKPTSLSLNSVGQSLLPSQSPPGSMNTPSDAGESLKSPNMSTDSGFEGENNRPLLLTTMPSPSKDTILSSWSSEMFCQGKERMHFDGSDLTSPKSPKKSMDDSDFNESPFDKKPVPGVSEVQSESDNELGSEHNCTFFTNDSSSWGDQKNGHLSEHVCVGGRFGVRSGEFSAFGVCISQSSSTSEDHCLSKNKELNECSACQKMIFIDSEDSVYANHGDTKWSGRLASIHEDRDCVIYAENEMGANSEEDYDSHCKPDTETDTSDEKIFDGAYSDETLSAYYVPSAVSVTTEDYQQPSKVLESKMLVVDMEENSSEEESSSPCLCHIGMCKSSHCQRERSRYTTVLKPKAVRPSNVPNRVEYHSSLESLHGQHLVAAIGHHHHNRLSAFHERPASSLSQNEGMQYFFSRSLDMPTSVSTMRQTSSHLSVEAASSDFIATSSCGVFNESHNEVSSLNNIDTLRNSSSCNCKSNSSTLKSSSSDKGSSKSMSEAKKCDLSDSSLKSIRARSPRAKRFSMPWDLLWKNEVARKPVSASGTSSEPIHMTLEEVHSSLQILTPQDSLDGVDLSRKAGHCIEAKNRSSSLLGGYLRSKRTEPKQGSTQSKTAAAADQKYQRKSFPVFIKSAFSSLFGLKKTNAMGPRFSASRSEDELSSHTITTSSAANKSSPNTSPFSNRALPPLPVGGENAVEWRGVEEDPWTFDSSQSQYGEKDSEQEDFMQRQMDYAASIEKVKDCGWYWGPISGETAEKLLSGEPDGSFVVRDSSDEHYIFSLTFKLNGLVRHVRIEHDHGNFSFGCLQKFRSNTIVDFIDSAVAHSRSGRYLFFLHRRPVLGPMRVQLLHPVSRFKQVQSLQHLCRFIILKTLRRDLIECLPLPRRLKDYLNTPHYYSEELATLSLQNKRHPDGSCKSSSSSQRDLSPSGAGGGGSGASSSNGTVTPERQPSSG